MWKGESLLNFATLITLWVLATQYFVNFYVRKWLKDRYYLRKNLVEEEANEKVDGFERKLRVVVVLTLGAAAVLGTIGWFTS